MTEEWKSRSAQFGMTSRQTEQATASGCLFLSCSLPALVSSCRQEAFWSFLTTPSCPLRRMESNMPEGLSDAVEVRSRRSGSGRQRSLISHLPQRRVDVGG